MRPWHAAVLLNVAVLVGVGFGYIWWGRPASHVAAALSDARARADRLERELAAARTDVERGAPRPTGDQQWEVRGVVRAILDDRDLVVMTHDEIPGYMPAMTMAFRASREVHDGVKVGDTVRFTLRGTPPDVSVTEMRPIQ
jgi:Cu/Ag efflux protein CusF